MLFFAINLNIFATKMAVGLNRFMCSLEGDVWQDGRRLTLKITIACLKFY